MRTLIVHNPDAGDGNLDEATLTRLFEASGHDVIYRHAKDNPPVPEDAAQVDLVVVAGGDGTVGEAVRSLHGAERPFVIVPLGTANNIATGLGLPRDPTAIARGCAHCSEQRLDLGIAEGPWTTRVFVEGTGIGALSELIAAGEAGDLTYEQEKRFGTEAPAPFLSSAEAHSWAVEVDGTLLPHALIMVEFLNMPLVGPGLPIGLGGWPDDGLLDIAFLRPEARDAFAAWLDGRRSRPAPGLEILQGRRVSFVWSGEPLRIDDHLPDFPGRPARIDIRVQPRRLRILVPEGETGS